jgi:hypothetical protein
VYHRSFFTDAYHPPAIGRVRPDLRLQGVKDWESIPVEPGYVFRSVGPATGIQDGTRNNSGLVSSIAVGSDPAHLLIGTRAGGVWSSTDEGRSWSALADSLPSLQTMTVARFDDAGNPPLFLAGSGDANEAGARDPALVGVFRSIDGGKTWAILDGGAFGTRFRSHDINNVVAIDRARVLVATRIGLFFSKDGGRNFGADADYKDGRPVLSGHVTDIVVDGTTIAVAVCGDPPDTEDPPPTDVIVQASAVTVPPGMHTADLLASGLSAFTLVRATMTAPADEVPSKTVLGHHGQFWLMSASKMNALIVNLGTGRPASIHSIHVTRRSPALATGWGRLRNADVDGLSGTQTTYSHTAAIEPSTSKTLFDGWFGAVALMRVRGDVSTGAWSLTSAQRGTHGLDGEDHQGPVHDDIHTVRVDQLGATRRVLAGTDGGVSVSTNAGSDWESRNSHATCLLWSISFARISATEARLLCGLQDNGSIVGVGPFEPAAPSDWTWKSTGPGDGGANTFIPSARDRIASDNPSSAFITANGSLLSAKAQANQEWTFDVEPGGVTTPPGFIYSETVALARGTGGDWDRVYFGNSAKRNGEGTLRSRDGTGSFTVIAPPAPNPQNSQEFRDMITAIAVAPEDVSADRQTPGPWDQLWIGLANGELWFSRTGGLSLHPVNVGGGQFPIAAIAVDPEDSRRIAVVYAGFKESPLNGPTGHVFLSENGGATFRDISGRRGATGFVPDLPVLSACFTRTRPPVLVIGTDIGILMTRGPDFGERWSRLGHNLPKVPCSQLSALNDFAPPNPPRLEDGLPPIAVATFGRGAFVLVRPSAAEAVIELDGGFGAMRVGERRTRTATLHNVGNAPLTLGAPTLSAPFSLSGVPTGSLGARSQASFTVTCEPSAEGAFSADFTIGGLNVPVSCEAFSDGEPRLSMYPRLIVFGDVPEGQAIEQVVHLQNVGQSELRITQIVGTLASGFSFAPAIPPEQTLAPGAELAVTLRLQPAGVGSDLEGNWQIRSNDPIADTSHFELVARAHVVAAQPASGGGTPGWVPWVIAGAVVVALGIGIGVGVYLANQNDEEE